MKQNVRNKRERKHGLTNHKLTDAQLCQKIKRAIISAVKATAASAHWNEKALEFYVEAGTGLAELQERCEARNFKATVQAKIGINIATAYEYMKIAKGGMKVLKAKRKRRKAYGAKYRERDKQIRHKLALLEWHLENPKGVTGKNVVDLEKEKRAREKWTREQEEDRKRRHKNMQARYRREALKSEKKGGPTKAEVYVQNFRSRLETASDCINYGDGGTDWLWYHIDQATLLELAAVAERVAKDATELATSLKEKANGTRIKATSRSA